MSSLCGKRAPPESVEELKQGVSSEVWQHFRVDKSKPNRARCIHCPTENWLSCVSSSTTNLSYYRTFGTPRLCCGEFCYRQKSSFDTGTCPAPYLCQHELGTFPYFVDRYALFIICCHFCLRNETCRWGSREPYSTLCHEMTFSLEEGVLRHE